MKQFSLQALMNKIDWLSIEPMSGRSMSGLNDIAVQFKKDKKDSEIVDRVIIKIGAEVAKQLGWTKGDRLFIYNDPDDLMLFRILKSNSNTGWKLQPVANTPHFQLSFKWTASLPLTEMKPSIVKHTVFMENVFFRIGDTAEFTI
jgi:hypothetical protein